MAWLVARERCGGAAGASVPAQLSTEDEGKAPGDSERLPHPSDAARGGGIEQRYETERRGCQGGAPERHPPAGGARGGEEGQQNDDQRQDRRTRPPSGLRTGGHFLWRHTPAAPGRRGQGVEEPGDRADGGDRQHRTVGARTLGEQGWARGVQAADRHQHHSHHADGDTPTMPTEMKQSGSRPMAPARAKAIATTASCCTAVSRRSGAWSSVRKAAGSTIPATAP